MKEDNLKKEEIITNDEAQALEGGASEVYSTKESEIVAGDGNAAICCVGKKDDL